MKIEIPNPIVPIAEGYVCLVPDAAGYSLWPIVGIAQESTTSSVWKGVRLNEKGEAVFVEGRVKPANEKLICCSGE